MSKKLAILLPGPRRQVVGGYKILYQYADILASKGFHVTFFYLTNSMLTGGRFNGVRGWIKQKILAKTKFYRWFNFNYVHNHLLVDKLWASDLADYGLIFLSSVESVLYYDRFCKSVSDSKKVLYFIQDYENWNYSNSIVEATYRLPYVKNVTISTYLKNIIINASGIVNLFIPNSIDLDTFQLDVKWSKRKENSILFMYHPGYRKGCDILINGIKQLVSNSGYEFTFECFSVYEKPDDFPDFVKYNFQPTRNQLNDIYNRNRYFVCSSRKEGFGLTPAEAMACGCVVLSTDNGGVSDFIIEGVTGFYFNEIDEHSIVKLILDKVSSDKEDLELLAERGSQFIASNHSWSTNAAKLASFISSD